MRAHLSIRAPPCFLIANYATSLDVGGENSFRTWIKFFIFLSSIYSRKSAYLSFENSTPPQLISA